MKKTAPITAGKAKKKAWKMFSLYIRVRDAKKTVGNMNQCKCISCPTIKNVTGIGSIQAGHFIPGRHGAVLFNEELVHGQCYHCNVGLKGNWIEYERAMVALYGREKVEEFKQMSKGKTSIIKRNVQDYLDIEAKYKQLLKEIGYGV